MKKGSWRKIFYVVSACLITLSLSVYALRHVQVFVVLNGEEEVTVPVFQSYEDPGATNRLTHAKIAPEGDYDTTKIGDYKLEYKTFFQTVTRLIHVIDDTPPSVVLYGPSFLQVPVGTQIDASGVIALGGRFIARGIFCASFCWMAAGRRSWQPLQESNSPGAV